MKRFGMAIFCVALAGCAAIAPNQFVGPNGKVAYSMQCSGLGRTLDACYKKAGELCPVGYTTVDRSSSIMGIPVNGSVMVGARESLAIECK